MTLMTRSIDQFRTEFYNQEEQIAALSKKLNDYHAGDAQSHPYLKGGMQ